MRDMEQQARQANGNQASTSGFAPVLPTPGAMVPYQAPLNDVRNDPATGSGNGGYYGGYSGGYNNYRRPWYSEPRDKNEKVEKMWSWMSEEMEERQRLRREREAVIKKELEEKKKKEDEEKRLAEIKDKEDFKTSIGKMVESQMRTVCQEVLGKKVGEGERLVLATTAEIHRRTDANHDSQEIQKKDEEIIRLKQTMAEMQRQACRPNQSEQELNSLKVDNQHLIQDVISLKEQVGELVKVVKPILGVAATGGSVPTTVHGIVRTESTPGDYVKLADAYRKLRDDKGMAEREVQALKDRITRIGSATCTPTSIKRKRVLRKSVSPPASLRIHLNKAASPAKKAQASDKSQANLQFVKLKNEVCEEASVHRTVQTEEEGDRETLGRREGSLCDNQGICNRYCGYLHGSGFRDTEQSSC
ncbi:hypothetical protein CBR_g37124 [Chara braunii]|uniref:Uncharacterized protein n=1 Tax=Chara braunii TaxID=69332 RepID=A0A388LM58_CHABU|nr:hypothetical protein CBR_g37124 [Chara braunii]|eukprot:GBG83410.1 hypothetical protein CBR_g37124 [Chara braunii]